MYNFSISSYNSSLQHQQQNNPPNKTKQNPNYHSPNHHNHTHNQPTNHHNNMFTDESACNTYNYGDSVYWDARYIHEASAGSFDWYQRYHALRPFVTKYVPLSSRILMVGCGNAVMSEDMVKDGYEDIMNVDISCVAIEMMRRKYEHVPQLKYLQMDVRDMGFFLDDSFDSVIDKGTLDSLMCGTDAPISASQMLGEVSRLRSPSLSLFCFLNLEGPIYCFPTSITLVLGFSISLTLVLDPLLSVSVSLSLRLFEPHCSRNNTITDHQVHSYRARPGFQKPPGSTSSPKSHLSPVPTTEKGMLPADYVLEDPDSHYIYVCTKMGENPDPSDPRLIYDQ
ncbi:hypothetical protein M8C21_029560 [Ambrosia artemisiifolia]|uniref:Methyltransferase type 11 domain-containing protein n=1 Tax=Ambrosia artemisiifolia TaxID=4212 RepID=A0AAD5BNQ0_AMBAR|nr:hypothetical protein M8C21_029560 [Ambrosia artemisiifolia]